MRLTYDVTVDDLVAFNYYCANTSRALKRNYRIMLVAVPLLVFGLNLLLFDFDIVAALVSLAVTSLFWLFVYPRAYRSGIERRVRKLLTEGSNRGMTGVHTMVIDQDGIVETTDVNESRFSWQGIERVEENKQYIFLFLSPILAHVIPKRAFEREQDAHEFFTTAKMFWASVHSVQPSS